MSGTIDLSCNILDDEELERVGSTKPRRMELRQWIPDLAPKENPFEKGFIKPTYSFPKAFQNKIQSEEFPPLLYRGGPKPVATNPSTTTLLMRVKEKLEKQTPPPQTTVLSIVSTTTVQPKEEVKTPIYAICTPDYAPQTPPYPPE